MYFNGTGVGRDYSEASEGWRVLPTRYDDPAYSGGNLDRPALPLETQWPTARSDTDHITRKPELISGPTANVITAPEWL